jgi:hypothetical protein
MKLGALQQPLTSKPAAQFHNALGLRLDQPELRAGGRRARDGRSDGGPMAVQGLVMAVQFRGGLLRSTN